MLPKFEVWREGKCETDQRYARELAQKIFYSFVSNELLTEDSWLNFPVESLNQSMTIPRHLMDQKTEYGKRLGVNVNTAISGSTCDLHHGTSGSDIVRGLEES